MIINIRGTSGSGKTTLARAVMACYPSKAAVKVPDRKRPIGYIYQHPAGGRPLAVIGHYETACGGCDTITDQDHIYELVRQSHSAGMDVLYEGLLISAEVNRAVKLHEDGLPLLVVALDTPLELCLTSINQRRQADFDRRVAKIEAENAERAARGRKLLELPEPKGDVNPKNTASKFSGVKTSMKRLDEAGVRAVWADRDQGLEIIKKELGL
jgi:hypothetical protein